MNNCSANAVCNNLVGSFGCECNTGFSGDGITCTGESQYYNHGRVVHNYQNITVITNQTRHLPAPLITLCPAPFISDIDECALGTDNCADANSTCANTPGSFACTCDAGYSGDGTECIGE